MAFYQETARNFYLLVFDYMRHSLYRFVGIGLLEYWHQYKPENLPDYLEVYPGRRHAGYAVFPGNDAEEAGLTV